MTTSSLAPSLGTQVRRRTPASLLPMVLPLADVAGLTTACVVSGWVVEAWAVPGWVAGGYAIAVLVLLVADGQHRLRICRRVAEQLPRTVAVAAMPLLVVLPWAGADGVTLALLCVASLIAVRVGVCTALKLTHRRGWLREPALVIGGCATAVRVVTLLRERPELGLTPCGFLDSRSATQRMPAQQMGVPLLGELAELNRVIAWHGIRRVIVCSPGGGDEDLVPLLRACRRLPVDICVVPRCYELGAALPRGCLDELGDIPLVPLRRLGHGQLGAAAKTAFDLIGATALLLALFPVLLTLAIAVRLDGGGQVLFRQTRLTRAGEPMELIKLRSMAAHEDSDTRWAVLPDQASRLGRWLRQTHLDELPQLVNVLRGEMSLVGPRPERPYFAARFATEIPRYDDRHRMRTGLTGWAQVNGLHGDTSIAERIRFDNFYIEHWSPWMDLVILTRTLCTGAGGGRQ
ncbi:MAG TPA: sugar transferase [Pseudonocardiaceae bacterium]|nr:sugar transferase [Pseudonocardiaceae bacterium]